MPSILDTERGVDARPLRPDIRDLLKDISIPPRPSSLVDLKLELERDEPRMAQLVAIVNSDVAMSAALLKLANSPWLGMSRRIATVPEAFQILGYKRCEHILTEIALRKVLPTNGPALFRFWDVSSKRSQAMGLLARRVGLDADTAQTMGLFADVGIPLLALRFAQPSYIDTLDEANRSEQPFTNVEQDRHGTDHTVIGALLARSWGLDPDVASAVRLHHDYEYLDEKQPGRVHELIALCLVVEHIIQRFQGLNAHAEWSKGGQQSLKTLSVSQADLDNWADELHERFAAEH
ncbi:MAG: HDOD domain-containing protein [Burkholderiales bacterium]|jgi:HD-like signal output (HDOD) protein|nr:MAG: HDOD domain-containing protein [Burkholderiales bacterium]